MKKTTHLNLLLIIFCLFVLQACGPSIPKSALNDLPPLIEIVSLDAAKPQLKLRVSHRNKTTRENNQLSCQLALKDYTPIKFNRIALPDLTTYAKETVDVTLDSTALEIINKQTELPYVLDCFLFSENFREEQVINKSTLFKVPGTRAEYR